MHENKKPMAQFWRDHGYTALLLACVAAVVVTGAVFLRTVMHSGAEALLEEEVSLSVPVSPEPVRPKPEPVQPPRAAEEQETFAEEPSEEASRQLVIRPVPGQVSRGYSMDQLSYSPTMKDWRIHAGVDLAAEQGSPVRAAMDGSVSAVYDDDFLGTTVELTHADGVRTVYANLTQMPTVSVGDTVTAGSVIGAVGGTALGESGELPHLHFAVYRPEGAADPGTLLER